MRGTASLIGIMVVMVAACSVDSSGASTAGDRSSPVPATDAPSSALTVSGDPAAPVEPTTSASLAAPPAWALDVVAELGCAGPPQQLGAVVGDRSLGIAAGATPEQALASWLRNEAGNYLVLPLGGFASRERADHWALFAHEVGGRAKAVVLVSDVGDAASQGPWSATTFAACDAAEFDPDTPLGYDVRIWRDDDGPVSTTRLLERADCYQARVLRVDGQLFVQDPTGVGFEAAQLLTTYDANVTLPSSAAPTPYMDGDRHLYLGPGEAAYVRSPEGVERWPRVRGDEYMRIDCN